jgi:hypothetical protein
MGLPSKPLGVKIFVAVMYKSSLNPDNVLKMLDDKKQRMASAMEELRQKEASVDLVYNSLVRVEDDLKFGRPITQIFPSELYTRFGLTPPADQNKIPPLVEKSSQDS